MRVSAMRTMRAWTLGLCLAAAVLGGSLFASGPELAMAAVRKSVAKSAPLSLVHHKVVARKRFKPVKKRRRVWRKRRVWHKAAHLRRRHPEPRRAEPPARPAVKRAVDQKTAVDDRDGIVTIAAGGVDGTDAQIASDIGAAVDRPGVRVLPVLSRDSLKTVRDLGSSPVIDVALVHSDVLDEAKSEVATISKQIGYIARLFDEEVCVLAGSKITSLRQLDGKKVAVGVVGSGAAVTAGNIFGRLGIHPQFVNTDTPAALAKLDSGQLAAVVIVAGEPAPALLARRASGVHALPIPYDPALQAQYFPAKLTHADYPRLVPPAGVDTIAVGTLLVAPMDSSDKARNERIGAFARAFLSNFDALLRPGRHPKWKDVNLAADAPGWTRIPAAKEWLDSAEADQEQQFTAFATSHANANAALTDADHERLFREFVQWKRKQGL